MPVDYDPAFYDAITAGSLSSAEVVVPMVLDLFDPPVSSVVDVGCGRGAWSVWFADAGCDVVGVDGPWVSDPIHDHIVRCDLTRDRLPGRLCADLVVCLEVAEHLPESMAAGLVDDLVSMADRAVLFSAAIPRQGGHGHVNERWPSYWAAMFASAGWTVMDGLRQRIWSDVAVEPWYRQNLLLAVPDGHDLPGMARPTHLTDLDMAHPTIWGWRR